jgi:hypothetical protein
LRLPRRGLGANTLMAVGNTFFVYPTKLREYQSRYRGSFLHGGVTPEEVIVPLALLTPQGVTNTPHGERATGAGRCIGDS